MKLLVTLLSLFILTNVNAVTCDKQNVNVQQVKEQIINTDVPEFLKGATIIVRLKDGTETSVSAEKFKVVPRKQQFIVTKIEIDRTCFVNKTKSSRVSALGGYGLNGSVDTTRNGNSLSVKPGMGAIGGLQYQYKFENDFSLGLQGQTNGSGFFLIGVDF